MADDPTPSSPKPAGIARFWAELKRRKVRRVAITYIVVAWLVIQVAVNTFPSLLIPGWALSFVVMCVILGFPVALVLAWAFELTPEGIRTTKGAQKDKANSTHPPEFTRKKKWMTFAFGAAFPTAIFGALALFFFVRSPSETQVDSVDKSIAVLPFANRSELKDDEFFTDGIHDDLLTHLSRIKDIKTIARTSVMGYRDTTKKMSTIGEELGVSWLLEGGVQRGGDQIRINVQLIDPATEGHLWAEIYTREMTTKNIFAIQNEIVSLIADSLRSVISPEEKERIEKLPTQNLAALEAYFRGKESIKKGTTSGWDEGIEHFKKAISLDRNFALAHTMLGRSVLLRISASGLRYDEEKAKAEPHIFKALELDDTLSEGYVTLGLLRRRQGLLGSEQGRIEAAEAFKKAIQLNPNNATAYQYYAGSFSFLSGRNAKIASLYRKAYELDPKSDSAPQTLASSHEALGQWEEAVEVLKSYAEEQPELGATHAKLGNLYGRNLGRFDDAIVSHRKQLALNPESQNANHFIGGSYADLGDIERAIWWFDRYLESQQDPMWYARWECHKFNWTGDDVALEQSARQGIREKQIHALVHSHLTDIELASGNALNARTRMEKAYPTLFGTAPNADGRNQMVAKDVARVLIATGEREQANRLIAHVLEVANSNIFWWTPILKVDLYALAEDDRQTLDAIRIFFDEGGSPYRLMLEDELKRFENNPEYQAMAEKRKAELAIQLKRINEMEANGELPPIPDRPAS